MVSFDRTISFDIRADVKVKKAIDSIGQTIISYTWAFNKFLNELNEADTDGLIEYLLTGEYDIGDAAFQRRNGLGQIAGLLSPVWEQAIVKKWNSMAIEKRNQFRKAKNQDAADVRDILFWGPEGGLKEFQTLMRLNANEYSGVDLDPKAFGGDRVINEIIPDISGEFRNRHTLIIHPRMTISKRQAAGSGGNIES